MKVQRRFVAWVSLAALWLGLLAGGAAAAPALTLSQGWGPPTLSLTVKGSGFPANTVAELYFDFLSLALAATDGAGAFTRTVKVPSGALPGTHWITAYVRATAVGAQKSFTVRTPWRQFQGIDRHTGWNPFENVLNSYNLGNLDLAWAFDGDGPSYGSFPIMDYNLYYKSQNKIYCLNPMTGAKIWDSGSVLAWTFGTPAVGGGRVFVNNNGTVVALNAATGAKLWESAYPERLGSSPTLSGNAVYVTAGKPYVPPGEFPPEDGYTRICSLNAATGALLWDTGPFTTDLSWATPAVAYGRVYATFPDGRLYAFDQATGAKVWDKEATGYGYTLAVANGRIFASGDKLYAFNAFTGFKSWDSGTSITENIVASPVVANNRVYVAASWPSAGRVYAFNASTGAKLWSSEAVMVASNSPLSLMVAGGVIYIGSGSKVFAFDTGGNLIWSGETGTTLPPYPMVANGKVYVSAGLKLYAFDLENSAYYASLRARQAAAARRPDMAALVPDPDLKLEE